MQGLCCLDVQGNHAWGCIEDFIRDSRESELVVDAAMKLLVESFDDRAACDELLRRHARRWDLPRLALVDRNILRLSVHELRTGKAPYKVLISESLRLAREFSTNESPRFINGVLDAVARELLGPEEEVSTDEHGNEQG
jgi:N utilization substance protein B